jgi:hypothetical protein
MAANTPALRLDTSALQLDLPTMSGGQTRSPGSSVRSRAISALPTLRVPSTASPSVEKSPLSPFLPKSDAGAGKGKAELVKALSFQLDQISQRQKPPTVLEVILAGEFSENRRGPSLQAIGKSLSADLNGLVGPDDSDDEENKSKFTPDAAADLTQNLRNVLLISLERGFNLFEEE